MYGFDFEKEPMTLGDYCDGFADWGEHVRITDRNGKNLFLGYLEDTCYWAAMYGDELVKEVRREDDDSGAVIVLQFGRDDET